MQYKWLHVYSSLSVPRETISFVLFYSYTQGREQKIKGSSYPYGTLQQQHREGGAGTHLANIRCQRHLCFVFAERGKAIDSLEG